MDVQVDTRSVPRNQRERGGRMLRDVGLAWYAQGLHGRLLPSDNPVVLEINSGRRIVPYGVGLRYRRALDRPHFVLGRPDVESPVVRLNGLVTGNPQRIVEVLVPGNHFP